MEEFLKISESPLLWMASGTAVILVLAQAFIFLRKSWTAGRKLGIQEEQLKSAFRTGLISSIGPSAVVVVGMISLLLTVGGPVAWMRLSYIGNVAYELLSVSFSAQAYGVPLNRENMTPEIFSVALWTMTIGASGWVVVTALFTPRLDQLRMKLAGKKTKLVPVISSAAMLGAYSYFNTGYLLSFNRSTVALLVGFTAMASLISVNKKLQKRWINEWGLTISMFLGMLTASVL